MSKENTNSIGLTQNDYKGAISTLCTGCGHDSVTKNIIQACFQSDIRPTDVVKVSGIGCSSKTTNYFMNESHGFNSIHGRMAPVATGAKLANRELKVIGVSGDGDSASIGLGSLLHLFRRDVPMLYILENNAVYGLTKGQFSATASDDMQTKAGDSNPFTGLDLCALAIQSGCRFVARSFSNDNKQLVPLIRAALEHNGTAFIDIVSPCITYANHPGSTLSYDYVKEHKVSLQELGVISDFDNSEVSYDQGDTEVVKLASGMQLTLKKLQENYDFTSSEASLFELNKARQEQHILTGLIYYKAEGPNVLNSLRLSKKALVKRKDQTLNQQQLDEALKEFM